MTIKDRLTRLERRTAGIGAGQTPVVLFAEGDDVDELVRAHVAAGRCPPGARLLLLPADVDAETWERRARERYAALMATGERSRT